VFSCFYLYGAWAVQFFWVLSGFIFFHVYTARRDVPLREFFINRFSRLYPLHVITLCIIAALQFASWVRFGHFQIYPFNDAWHFLLNVFMASHWGFQEGWSFNAPIWSISVEVLVYAMFYSFLRAFGIRLLTSLIWLGWSLLFYVNTPNSVFECAALFALGGCVNQLHAWLTERATANLSLGGVILVLASILFLIKSGAVAVPVAVKWGVFPGLVWLAAVLDAKGLSSGRAGIAMGSITYSSYLLHVPIQITLIILMDAFVGNRHIVSSPAFLVAYIFSVIGMAALTYKFVEYPLKVKCKQLFNRPKSAIERISVPAH
jgi:peptidoglycan/LPS O-acetylase OafA/YrhL